MSKYVNILFALLLLLSVGLVSCEKATPLTPVERHTKALRDGETDNDDSRPDDDGITDPNDDEDESSADKEDSDTGGITDDEEDDDEAGAAPKGR